MSSENEKKSGEPGSGPKTEITNPVLWKEDLGEICAICAYEAVEHRSKDGACPVDVSGLLAARQWRGTKFQAVRKVRIVETGYVGAPPAIPSARLRSDEFGAADVLRRELDGIQIHALNIGEIRARYLIDGDSEWNAWVRDETAAREGKNRFAKCPHCQHFGQVDHECSHETCANCGMALDEAPAEGLPGATGIPGPPDGKMSAAELLEIREIETAAGGGVCPKCALVFVNGECPNCHFSGTMQAFRGPEAEPAAEKLPCECWKMAGFRNCPRHRHLCEPPDSPAFQTGVGAATEPPFDNDPGPIGQKCVVCGIDLADAPRGFVRGAPKGVTPALWQCPEHLGPLDLDDDSRIFAPAPGSMPSWFPEMLGEARAADLADAGHRLAKCGVCGRLLYEKSGVFIHDGSGVEHVGVPTEIFDPAPANTAGVCFTCPPVGFFEALLNRLFPQEFPKLPEVEWAPPNAAPKGDVIHLTAVTEFSVLDRLRLIVSGRMMTRAMIVCENEAGRTKSVMTVRPLAPGRGRE